MNKVECENDRKMTIFQSIESYRTIVETAHDLIWTLDDRGNFTFFNKRCEETSGYELSEWLGKSFSPLIYPEDLPKVQEIFLKTLQGNPQSYEVRVYDKNGNIFILSVNTVPLYENDRIIGTVSFGRDITEHKKMEESIRESEERYRNLVELSPDAIGVQIEGKIAFINTAGAKLLGAVNPEQLIGKPVLDFVHPDYRGIAGERIRRIIEERKIVPPLEEKFIKLDKTVIDVEVTAAPITYKDKPAVQVIIRDISGRKRVEEALRQSEEKYRMLIDNIQDGVFIIQDSKVQFANEAFARIVGYAMDEIIGKDIRELIAPEDLGMVADRYYRRQAGEDIPGEYEFRAMHRSGKRIIANINAGLITYGGRVATMGTVKDITERKKAEEIRLENERLVLASKAKSEFFATMSHELRTPLTSIIGFSELLKDKTIAGELNEQQDHFVDKVLANSNHLLEIIKDILDLSKIEAGKTELVIEKFQVPEAIEEAMALIKGIALELNITTKKEFEPMDIEADRRRFKQILFNLLSNAVKFSKPGGGIVTITAKKSGDMSEISVSDTGIGIKKEDIGRLFWSFEQLDSGISRKYGGTGLGLAISKKLVELHGGKITVESKYGEGSTFTFLLPLKVKRERIEL